MNTKTIIFTILLLTAFIVTSIVALSSAKKMTTVPTYDDSANNPDFFMTRVIYTKFNHDGEIRNTVITNKMIHFTTNNVGLFEKPQITLYNSTEEPCNIIANQGRSDKGKEKIYLWDNVKITQKVGPNNPDLNVITTALTFYPETKLAETKESVTIIQNDDITEAVGAEANFKTESIKLWSKVVHTKFDEQGQIKYKVYTDTTTHLINDKVYLLEKPQIIIFNPKEEPCQITANHGKSKDDNKTIHLRENVRVIQAAGLHNSDLDVTTTALTFYPETKLAETTEPVTVIQNGNTTKAVGAKINLRTSEVKFISKFEGVFNL
ncbi:MAG: LPS export ABC transporter periplasmic protein LptC [Coxiellaceae bacterium]|jgi:lipopolysaccharide export system protein LptC|nr:LPS export ABC transporter periplasmic protein LptC [Coxiellaceae bacterium]